MSKHLISTSFQCFFLVLQCLILLSLQNCALSKARTAGKPHNLHTTRTVRVKSLLPKATCHTSTKPKGMHKGSYLKVVQRHGPCARQQHRKANVPTLTQIHFNDRSRVDFLHSKAFRNMDNYINENIHNLRGSPIPIEYSTDMTVADYTVTMGLGTPKQVVSLTLDIAAFTWLVCIPEMDNHMYFNPTKSKTITSIPCDSPLCSELNSTEGVSTRCFKSKFCNYDTRVYEAAQTKGFVVRDTLTITSSNVVENFLFGCSNYYNGFQLAAPGILGLGRGNVSLLKQTEKEYRQVFSYCLPSDPSYNGYLWLGDVGSDSVKYVPMMSTPYKSTYSIEITGISVDGNKLDIPKTVFSKVGSIIDVGATYTWLPAIAYDALQAKFRMYMEYFYQPSKRHGSLHTCFDITGHEEIEIPKVSFHFSDDLEVKLQVPGIIYIPNESEVCLAFGKNENENSMTMFGNAQQRTLEIVIDNGQGRIGFGPRSCS